MDLSDVLCQLRCRDERGKPALEHLLTTLAQGRITPGEGEPKALCNGASDAVECREAARDNVDKVLPVGRRLPLFTQWDERHLGPKLLLHFGANKREHACQAAFGWMSAVLQKHVVLDALRREMVGVPDVAVLVDRLYYGSLADRNRAMVVLANHHGLKSGTVCAFLGINKKTQRKVVGPEQRLSH